MGRPSKQQLLATLLDTIREAESISVAQLQTRMAPQWKPATLAALLENALESGLVSKGQGGGGGVLRLTDLVSTTADANEEAQEKFMAALQLCTRGDYQQGVKSIDIQTQLGWSDAIFGSVRAIVQAQGRIALKRGPGAYVYILTATVHDTPKPSPSTNATQTEPVDQSHELDIDDINTLFNEIQRQPGRTNRAVRESLKWQEHEFWQTRTTLVDDGRLIAMQGDDGAIDIRQGNAHPVPDTSMVKILEHLIARAAPVRITDLIARLSIGKEATVMACTRLSRMTFVKAGDDTIMLANSISARDDPDSDMVELLRQLKDRNMAAKVTLLDNLGWGPERLQEALGKCVARKFAEDSIDIILKLPAGGLFFDRHKDAPSTTICRSPVAFEALREAVRKGEITAFVGSGVSADAGIPTWGNLLTLMKKEVMESKKSEEIACLIGSNDYVGAISAIESALGANAFTTAIQRELAADRCNHPSTSAIVALGCIAGKLKRIVTTNLDKLLELNLGREPVARLHGGNIQHDGKKIYHLHGFIDEPETWVLTRKQYNTAVYDNVPYIQSLRALFHERLMFVGYGMEDNEFDLILDQIEGAYKPHERSSHFFFLRAQDAAKRPYFVRRLEDLGMTPILYDAHENLPILLARLAMPREST